MWQDKEGMLDDADFSLAVIAILVNRLGARDGVDTVRITQEDFDNIAYRTLLEGQDMDTHDVLLKIRDKRELS